MEGERLAETGDERGFPYSMLDHGRGGWRGARVKLIRWRERERKKWHATRLRNLRHRLEIRLIGGTLVQDLQGAENFFFFLKKQIKI